DGGRVDRALDHVRQPADADRHPAAHGLIEDALGELGDSFHDRRATRDDDARRRRVLEPGPGELARHQGEDLLDARLDDLREELPRQLPRLAAADGRHVDRLLRRYQRGQRAAVALLDALGIRGRRAQPDRDVVGDVVTPSGSTTVCQTAPSRISATSVVPPPMSITTTPSSFSSSNSTASAEARGSSTMSWTARPARLTERTTFWTEVAVPVAMATSASRRP